MSLPLVDRLNGRLLSFSCEILKESSTQHEEHPYMGDFIFNGQIVRFVVGKLNPKTFI